MIELFGMRSPNVQKVILALSELELPFEFHYVDVFLGEQFDARFAALTPNRKVPVIVDHEGPDGQPLTLWESGAILVYLAEKTGALMPADARGRALTLQWLMFQMGGIGPMFGQDAHFQRFAPDAAYAYSRSRYRTEVLRLTDVVEGRLAESRFLAGDDFTIADVAAWPWLRTVGGRGADLAALPALGRWIDEIAQRPGARRAMAFIDQIAAPDIAGLIADHPDAMDRYLGRGAYSRAGA